MKSKSDFVGFTIFSHVKINFDENPFFFFTLRGIDVDRFIGVALESRVEKMLKNADVKSDRIIDDNITDLFGVV